MEDLSEVGRRVIAAIAKCKPADAGDLALGVESIINDLRLNPSQFEEKLNHLEGLFRELVYGEAYELREKHRPLEDSFIYASGIFSPGQQQIFSFPPISGSIPYQAPSPPVPNPCGEVALPSDSEECSLPVPDLEEEQEEEEEKTFKPAWWKVKIDE